MRLSAADTVVTVAGLLLLTFAAYQGVSGRSPELFVFAGVALVAFGLFRYGLTHLKVGPGGIDIAIDQVLDRQASTGRPAEDVKRQLTDTDQPDDVKLIMSPGMAVGGAAFLTGTEMIMQITAVNTSARPIGVSSLGFKLSDGRHIPVYETLPTEGNKKLPTVLQPQEHATTWVGYDRLEETLHDEGIALAEIVANLVDGTTRTRPVPDHWRSFGRKA